MDIKKARIALLGNMNGNHYGLFRYFKKAGINATLFIFNNDTFKPEDEPDYPQLKDEIKFLSWGSAASFFLTPKRKIKEDLVDYDFFLVCGLGGIFLQKSGIRKPYLYFVYGSELNVIPFYLRYVQQLPRKYFFPFRFVITYLQKAALKQADAICFTQNIDVFKKSMQELGLGDQFKPGAIYIDFSLPQGNEPSDELQTELGKLSDNGTLVLFSPMRHSWNKPAEPDGNKGNDIFLKGVSHFLKSNSDVKLKLILLEYGENVEDSKRLADQLGISERIFWLPRMSKGDTVGIYSYCHVVLDHLIMGIYGSIYIEGSLHKKPTIMHIKKDATTWEHPPHFEANNETDIKTILENLISDRQIIENAGNEAYNYVHKYHGEACGQRWVELIEDILNKQQEEPLKSERTSLS